MDDEVSTDTFRLEFILGPVSILSLLIHYRFSPMEVLWSFSIILESVAIIPQLHMLKITGQAEALTRYYILALGSYRAFYILNWIYRCVTLSLYDITADECVVDTSRKAWLTL